MALYKKRMSGSKVSDFDTYGLLRATHFHNPTRYANIGAVPKVFHPLMSKLMWA